MSSNIEFLNVEYTGITSHVVDKSRHFLWTNQSTAIDTLCFLIMHVNIIPQKKNISSDSPPGTYKNISVYIDEQLGKQFPDTKNRNIVNYS